MTTLSRALHGLAPFPLPALIALGAAPLGAQQSSAAFDAVRTGLGDLAVDSEATTPVRDLALARETGEIHLIEGTLALLRPIDGRPPGMVFAGDYPEDRETRDPDRTTLSALLNRGRDGHAFFHAHLLPGGERSSGEELFFRVDAAAEEAITFGRAGRKGTSTTGAIPRVTRTGLSTILNDPALDVADALLS